MHMESNTDCTDKEAVVEEGRYSAEREAARQWLVLEASRHAQLQSDWKLVNMTVHDQSLLPWLAAAAAVDASTCALRQQGQAEDALSEAIQDCWRLRLGRRQHTLPESPGVVAEWRQDWRWGWLYVDHRWPNTDLSATFVVQRHSYRLQPVVRGRPQSDASTWFYIHNSITYIVIVYYATKAAVQ